VAEADESDRSFLRYHPQFAVVTNVEADHLEHYEGSFELLVATFGQFLSQIKPNGVAVLCKDDPHLRAIGPTLASRVVWYGTDPTSDYHYTNARPDGFSTVYNVIERGHSLGEFRLAIPGKHNVLNSLSVIAIGRELGLTPEQLYPHLATFKGARRRFEVVAELNGVLVVDDYAHHPSEIQATLKAVRTGWPERRLVAVFQPHRYTRTHYLMDQFAGSFGDADHVVLTEVYSPPPDEPIPGASGARLAELTRLAAPGTPVDFVPEREAVAAHLAEICRSGDIVITMGAGDIWRTGRELARLRA
jgi:UDP-N-acetylmuramate--alanine ligase